jgi:uncharacterized membrane protein YdjX (TVP38/TMEM64 family)
MTGMDIEPDESPAKQGRGRKILISAIAIIAVAAVIMLSRHVDFQSLLRQGLTWVESLGPAGIAVFIAIYVIACVLLIPGSILTLGAGALFGVAKGTIAVSIGSTLGATAAFLIGRYFARSWVSKKIDSNKTFAAIDSAVADDGWKLVGLIRLSPIFPFNLLNYAFGLTRVKLSHYFLASWAGMLPATILYVYIGSLATDIATVGTTEQAKTPMQWVLSAVGLIATVAVTIFITRIARKALAERVPEDSEQEPQS